MIDKRVYELDYIRELQKKYVSDPGLIERALYAFGLLEAIKSVGMPFCFKGGTSLMLILEKPARLSTDIDILVEPGTDVDGYIGKDWSREDVLLDTIRACVSIISRGTIDKDEYAEYLRGIKSLRNHILLSGYNTDDATWKACKVMYLASCLLSGNPFKKIEHPESYISERLEGDQYKKLAYIRKQRPDAYACLVEATRNLI